MPGPRVAVSADPSLLLTALDALEVGVLVVDPRGRVLLANKAFTTSLGATLPRLSETALADRDVQVLRPDGSLWSEREWPVQDVLDHGSSEPGVDLVVLRRGVSSWLRATARPLFRPDQDRPYAAVLTFTDTTRRQAADRALQESEAHFRLLAQNSTDVITRHGADGMCLYASPAVREVLGREPAEMEGTIGGEFVHPEDRDHVLTVFRDLLRSGESSTVRYRLQHRDGHWLWAETVMRPVRAAGVVLELQSSTRDVSARVAGEQRLARLALADALTGLANRASLLQQLEDLQGQPLALLFLDLDRFKVVNDSLGHSVGDELLRTVAARLTDACRDEDVVARLGGDEFVVVAAGLSRDAALALAGRVQEALAAPVPVGGHELVAGASIGVLVTDAGDERDAEALLHDADVAMYRAKGRGHGGAELWTAATRDGVVPQLTLEQELRLALETGQLEVHYQPQIALATGQVVGVEALVRWCHPQHGLLLPGEFLPVADDSGLVVELGRQVLATAARQVAAWRRLPGCDQLHLSVNLSTRELRTPGQRHRLDSALRDSGLPIGALTLEVLESVLLDREGRVLQALESLVETGVQLALDDFGTGSSSLRHLRHLPIDVVKIDREFVAGLGSSRTDEAIVRALGALTGELGLACVAEGVELRGQRDWLLESGIGLAQGFLLCRPQTAADLTGQLVHPVIVLPDGVTAGG